MKKSFFYIEKNLDNGVLIYNTLSGAVISLDEKNTRYYNEEKFDEIEYLNTLMEQGIVVENIEKEWEEVFKMKDIFLNDNKSLYITILPTASCNLRCEYCFETLRNITMNDDVIEHMIVYLRKTLIKNNYKKLHVTWFGGEPLLYPDLVKKIYNLIEKLTEELNIFLSNSIITNGTFLNKDNVNLLKKIKNLKSVQVTVDGCRKIHDIRKPLVGSSSYEKIMNNLDQCVYELPINLRINVDKDNFKYIENFIKELSHHDGFKEKVKVYFGRVIGSPVSYTSYEFSKIRSIGYRLLKKYGFYYSIIQYLPEVKAVQCSALTKHLLVFDSNGDLYTCWETVGDKDYKIGSVYDGITTNNRKLKETVKEECLKCKVYPICHTGCPKQYKDPLQNNCMYIPELMINDIEEFIINGKKI